MNKLIPIVVLLSSLPSVGAAAPESVKASAAACFEALSDYKELLPVSQPSPVAGRPVFAPKPLASSYVSLSGQVNLQGSGYVSPGSRWVSVNLTGWTDVQDTTGHYRSGMTSISTMANLYLNGNWVSDWARPSVYVSLYKDGRYAGSAHVDGSIYVSGSLSGNWVNISGSGNLSGQASVSE